MSNIDPSTVDMMATHAPDGLLVEIEGYGSMSVAIPTHLLGAVAHVLCLKTGKMIYSSEENLTIKDIMAGKSETKKVKLLEIDIEPPRIKVALI